MTDSRKPTGSTRRSAYILRRRHRKMIDASSGHAGVWLKLARMLNGKQLTKLSH